MSEPRLQELAELLLEATEKGTVRWARTPDAESFRLELPPGYVRVSRMRSARGVPDENLSPDVTSVYHFVLLNKDGLEGERWTVPGSEGGDTLPEHLFNAARRSALEVDETYEGMVKRLRLMLASSKAS
jgi:hypothetical protein